uniref:Uncharacterized protein n=1 Tax=Avena sativa TaxID=4498 RepID=A0ACD5TLH2_AVESA
MASFQCEKKYDNDVQVDRSMKAKELFKKSKAIVVEKERLDNDAAAKMQIIIVEGTLKNQTKGPLSIMDSKVFAGNFVKEFPNTITTSDDFAMANMYPKGVKAAVVYSGTNRIGFECAWLLAFADTESTGRRIYAECGRKGKFDNINWENIEKNLDESGETTNPCDPFTMTSVYASIANSSGISTVDAKFLG